MTSPDIGPIIRPEAPSRFQRLGETAYVLVRGATPPSQIAREAAEEAWNESQAAEARRNAAAEWQEWLDRGRPNRIVDAADDYHSDWLKICWDAEQAAKLRVQEAAGQSVSELGVPSEVQPEVPHIDRQ